MGTELQSCDISSIDLTVTVKVSHFLLLLQQAKFTNHSCELLYISLGLRQQQIGELDEDGNLIISSQFNSLFTGKQSTSAP